MRLRTLARKARECIEYALFFFRSLKDRRRFFVANFSSNRLSYTREYYFTGFFDDKRFSFSSYRPLVCFFETHGDRKAIAKSNSPIKVLFTGENVHSTVSPSALEYSDYCLDEVDLSLGFDRLSAPNYLRFPLWLQYFFDPSMDLDGVARRVREFNARSFPKSRFCALVSAHDKTGIRERTLSLVNGISRVDCPGRFAHNDDTLVDEFGDNKESYLARYRFNLCPENDASSGYVTEKLFQAFWSDCIPIYWGADRSPEPDVVNDKAFVFIDPEDPDDALSEIRELLESESYYADFKSRRKLSDSAPDWIFATMSEAKERLNALIRDKGGR